MTETPSRILVVDDEPSITDFVSYALKKEGYVADVVNNGEDAFAYASKNNYDLFIWKSAAMTIWPSRSASAS